MRMTATTAGLLFPQEKTVFFWCVGLPVAGLSCRHICIPLRGSRGLKISTCYYVSDVCPCKPKYPKNFFGRILRGMRLRLLSGVFPQPTPSPWRPRNHPYSTCCGGRSTSSPGDCACLSHTSRSTPRGRFNVLIGSVFVNGCLFVVKVFTFQTTDYTRQWLGPCDGHRVFRRVGLTSNGRRRVPIQRLPPRTEMPYFKPEPVLCHWCDHCRTRDLTKIKGNYSRSVDKYLAGNSTLLLSSKCSIYIYIYCR